MPIETTPISESQTWSFPLITHTNGVQFMISMAPGAPTIAENDGDTAVQSLLDHLAAWPDRDTSGDQYGFQANKSETQTYAIDPTEEE
jgi:hypothetical protein